MTPSSIRKIWWTGIAAPWRAEIQSQNGWDIRASTYRIFDPLGNFNDSGYIPIATVIGPRESLPVSAGTGVGGALCRD
jgi:hypothetical protein